MRGPGGGANVTSWLRRPGVYQPVQMCMHLFGSLTCSLQSHPEMGLYRVSQEERSIFWGGGHSIGHSKEKIYMYMFPIPNGFRDGPISLCNSKLLIRKRYNELFLIPVFIVQVTKLIQFT
jgi:hypothetical protein